MVKSNKVNIWMGDILLSLYLVVILHFFQAPYVVCTASSLFKRAGPSSEEPVSLSQLPYAVRPKAKRAKILVVFLDLLCPF